jgi:hypothetical protein
MIKSASPPYPYIPAQKDISRPKLVFTLSSLNSVSSHHGQHTTSPPSPRRTQTPDIHLRPVRPRPPTSIRLAALRTLQFRNVQLYPIHPIHSNTPRRHASSNTRSISSLSCSSAASFTVKHGFCLFKYAHRLSSVKIMLVLPVTWLIMLA